MSFVTNVNPVFGQEECSYWVVGKITYQVNGVKYGYSDDPFKGYNEAMFVVRSYDIHRSISDLFNECPHYEICTKPIGEEQYSVVINNDIYINGGLIVSREVIKTSEIEGLENPENYKYIEKMVITPTSGTSMREGEATLTIESIVLYRLKPDLSAKMKKLHDQALKEELDSHHD